MPYEEWAESQQGVDLVQTNTGYEEVPRRYETMPDDAPQWYREQRSRNLKYQYRQLVDNKDPKVYQKGYYKGPNMRDTYGDDWSSSLVWDQLDDQEKAMMQFPDSPTYYHAEKKLALRDRRVFDEDGLRDFKDLDTKMYKTAVNIELAHIDNLLTRQGKRYIKGSDKTGARLPKVARGGGGETESGRPIIDSLSPEEQKNIQNIIVDDLYKDYDPDVTGKQSKLYLMLEEIVGGGELEVEDVKKHSKEIVEKLLKSNPNLKAVVNPKAFMQQSIIDHTKFSPDELEEIIDDFQKSVKIEVEGIGKPYPGTLISPFSGRAWEELNFKQAIRSVEGQELIIDLTRLWKYTIPRERDSDFYKQQDKIKKKIEKLAIINLKLAEEGRPPKGMKKAKYGVAPYSPSLMDRINPRVYRDVRRSREWWAKINEVDYDVESRIDDLADHLEAVLEIEVENRRIRLTDPRMRKIEFQNRITENALAELKVVEAQWKAIGETEGPEAAEKFLKSKKGLKALPVVGRIIMAGFLLDSATRSFLFGFDGSEPGSEGLMRWLTAPWENKGGAKYMTAETTPFLGDYLGLQDLAPILKAVLFPSWREQVNSMKRKAQERRYGREQAEREKGFKEKVVDYDATVKAAKRSAELSGCQFIVDPADPTKLIPPEELQKRRAARRRRLKNVGPPIQERKIRKVNIIINESKKANKSTKKLNIIIG